MSVAKYKSFCLTVRPRNGVTTPILDAMKKYCQSFPHYQMVQEGSAETCHLHIQIWLDKAQTKGDVNKKLERAAKSCYEDWDDNQKRVLRNGTKLAYSDWIENYCIDNDLKGTSNVILDNRPEDSDEYYPTDQEQELAQRKSAAVDQRHCALELLFETWYEEQPSDPVIDQKLVAQFLSDMMFKSRKINVIIKPTDRYNLTKSLCAYINKSDDWRLSLPEPTLSAADKKRSDHMKELGYSEEEINKILR